MADRSYDTGWMRVGPSKFEELEPEIARAMNGRIQQSLDEKLNVIFKEMYQSLGSTLASQPEPAHWPTARLSDDLNVRVGYQVSGGIASGGGGPCLNTPTDQTTFPWRVLGYSRWIGNTYGGESMFVTDMQAALSFDAKAVPDDGLKFIIAQLTGLVKDYETAGIAVPEKLTAKIAETWTVITDRAAAEKKRRLNELNREYDRLYEQTHPKRKLEDIDAERKAILAELEPKG